MQNIIHIDIVPPNKIAKNLSFALPVFITNISKTSVIEELTGKIQMGNGLIFEPLQKDSIQCGHLDPGQKIVLTWILLAKKEGKQHINIEIVSTSKTIAKKSIQLIISSEN